MLHAVGGSIPESVHSNAVGMIPEQSVHRAKGSLVLG